MMTLENTSWLQGGLAAAGGAAVTTTVLWALAKRKLQELLDHVSDTDIHVGENGYTLKSVCQERHEHLEQTMAAYHADLVRLHERMDELLREIRSLRR